jgi:cold shock CspA family protein
MRGRIKFVDSKTNQWGFIIPDNGAADVHFRVSDVIGSNRPTRADADCPVEFDLEEANGKRQAVRITLLAAPALAATSAKPRSSPRQKSSPGHALSNWAFLPYDLPVTRHGRQYGSAFHLLAETALEERWFFGTEADPRQPYPILVNYLQYTFYRLTKEGKVVEKAQWAAFNTGLVDRLYDPIYALFERNDRPERPWRFSDFCIPGKGPSGKRLTSEFAPLPEPAKYFSSNFDMLLDTSQDIHSDYEHVIYDGIERDRFPAEFVMQHIPRGFDAEDYRDMPSEQRKLYLSRLRAAVEADLQCTRGIKNRLEDAKTLAEKRTKWNFKTAIPQYYPKFDTMSLLLPLALVNDEVVDIALVVTRNPSGSYQGRTVLPLSWAYENARLVCRPDSDWLTPNQVSLETTSIDDDDDPSDRQIP